MEYLPHVGGDRRGVGIMTNFIGFQTAVRHEAAVRTVS